MKNILIGIISILSFNIHATTFQVGSTKEYKYPNELYLAGVLSDGDTIEIDFEVYSGIEALAVWEQNNLLIKGVGGRPQLIANGEYIWGKGIWVLTGNNITVENVEFSGAKVPDENGAGIRLDGIGLNVKHCYFHDNENGILTANTFDGDILIEHSEFANNGFGDGFTHNLYIGHVNKLTFRYNYSHHTKIGHNLKSRAEENFILFNRIMDEESGNSSRLIDLPNGGTSVVMGNLLMQGQNAINNNLLGYGLEGLSNMAPHELYVVNNTFVNKRVASCIFLSIEDGTQIANVSNNIFTGNGTIINGVSTEMNTNLILENSSSVNFVNEAEYDYRLASNSPAINYGTTIDPTLSFSLTPDFVYVHPTNFEMRALVGSAIDAGAYEFEQTVAVLNLISESLLLHPNPTSGLITVDMNSNDIKSLSAIDVMGHTFFSNSNSNQMEVTNLPSGFYYLRIVLNGDKVIVKKFLKL